VQLEVPVLPEPAPRPVPVLRRVLASPPVSVWVRSQRA